MTCYKLSAKQVIQLDFHLKKRGPLLLSICFLFIGVVSYVLINDSIDLSSYQRSLSEDIKRFGVISKYEFALRQSTPAVLWLYFCVLYCMYSRLKTYNVVVGTRHKHRMAESQRILRNSLEQFFIHFFTLFIFVSYIDQYLLHLRSCALLVGLSQISQRYKIFEYQ